MQQFFTGKIKEEKQIWHFYEASLNKFVTSFHFLTGPENSVFKSLSFQKKTQITTFAHIISQKNTYVNKAHAVDFLIELIIDKWLLKRLWQYWNLAQA